MGAVYAEAAAAAGFTALSAESLNQRFRDAWITRSSFNHTRDEWAGLVDDVFQGLVPEPPSQSFFPDLYERFRRPEAWRLFDDALPCLDALSTRGIPLAVISNWDERLRPLLAALGLARYFETIVVSWETGFSKPSPVVFEFAVRKLGVPPASVVHIGDSPTDDVEGARAAGLQALLIDRSRPMPGADWVCSLEELPGRLL